MNKQDLTREHFMSELAQLRQRIAELEDLESKHKQTERALEAAEREKEAVLDSMSELVTFQDMGQRILWANRAAAESVGQSREQLVGRYCYEIWHQRNQPCEECPLSKALETCQIQEGEVYSQSGRIWFMRCYPVQDENGDFIGVVELTQDITEKRRMEEELLKVKKLESIGILAGGIAHDFNNLLSVIIGNISLALSYLKPEDRVYERLTEAQEASMRARDLIQQLLTFSRGGAPSKRSTSIPRLLRNAAERALSGSNVKCDFSISDHLRSVSIDEVQVGLVIHNMIMNAKEAMPEGGTIRVNARNANIGPKNVHKLKEGKYVRISIEDEGKGIPEEFLEKIFDPYFSTKEIATQKGMGLGLSMSHSIIKKHNGHISVKSEVGVGTSFYIHLPAHANETIERESSNEELVLDKGRILVMDEEEMMRHVALQMLNRLHYDVAFSKGVEEAVRLYEKAMKSGNAFDAIILGLTIPGDMRGIKAMQRLKEVDPEVKAIIASSYGNEPIVKNFRDHGFSGSLVKPYDMDELSQVLGETLKAEWK
jgi:PAS domain S-box-containing protein